MAQPETFADEIVLHDHLVNSLLVPPIAYGATQPYGKHDVLSNYLYHQMEQSGTADVMVAFIDETEKYIYKGDVDDQLNHEKMQRLFALVADMPSESRDGLHESPKEITLDERLKVWEHLFNADWVHMYALSDDLHRVLQQIEVENANYADAIKSCMRKVMNRKAVAFSFAIGFSDAIPRPNSRRFNINSSFKGYDMVREEHPEALATYNSIIALALNLATLKPSAVNS